MFDGENAEVKIEFRVEQPGRDRLRAATTDLSERSTLVWKEIIARKQKRFHKSYFCREALRKSHFSSDQPGLAERVTLISPAWWNLVFLTF